MFIREHELVWVVDTDLSKCFDTLNHDLILEAIRKRIADGSILNLLRLFLKSGVMAHGGWRESVTGSPQGGVISPLIANIYLDAFDQEMRRRGHRIVRYADDIVIFKKSKSAAENALKQAKDILEKKLHLTVNCEKTRLLHAREGIPYLGVIIRLSTTSIQPKRLLRFKNKVKAMTRRNSAGNLQTVISELNPTIRGFANYFRIANCKTTLSLLMQWIRRRLRAKQLRLWKKPAKLTRRLRQLGRKDEPTSMRMSRWRNSRSPLAGYAIPNAEIMKLGLYDMTSVETGVLPQVT